MEFLSNELLIEVYMKAVLLKANPEFIIVLEKEIQKRRLKIAEYLDVD